MDDTRLATGLFLIILIIAAFTAHAGAAQISVDKVVYAAGDDVVIQYDFTTPAEKNTVHRISIYRDPTMVMHIITWDATSVKGVQKWSTSGLWNGDYYVVLKDHIPMGLQFEEIITASSKFTIVKGATDQVPLISTIAILEKEFTTDKKPIFSHTVFTQMKSEIDALRNALGAL